MKSPLEFDQTVFTSHSDMYMRFIPIVDTNSAYFLAHKETTACIFKSVSMLASEAPFLSQNS